MNLVQVQEHLKGMPTQALMAYANGQNPQVPPYVALGELNRRKQMEQQPAQVPQGSVKEQIEQSLMQPQQLPGLAAQGVPVPQPPQPQGIPSQMPKQLAQSPAPVQMAGGGLASVPLREDMFNYAPGGIVAFDEGGLTNEKLARQVLGEQLRGETAMEEPENPDDVRERMAAKYPILKTLPGAQAEALATKLEAQDAAQKAKFQESEGLRGLAGLSNALIAAGEATRGQKGFGNQLGSAFGGFGKAYNAETAARTEREAKQELLERGRMVDVSKIRSDVEGLQRAQAEGRVGEAMKYKEALNKHIAEVEKTQGTAAAAVLKNQIDLAQLGVSRANANKPSVFAEQWKAMQDNPDLYRLYQGQGKAGELTFEEALKVVAKEAKDNGEIDLSQEDKIDRAQKYLDAYNRMRKSGSATDPNAPPAPIKQKEYGITDAIKDRLTSMIKPSQPNVVDFSKLPQ